MMLFKNVLIPVTAVFVAAVVGGYAADAQNVSDALMPKTVCFIYEKDPGGTTIQSGLLKRTIPNAPTGPSKIYTDPDGQAIPLTPQQCKEANLEAQQAAREAERRLAKEALRANLEARASEKKRAAAAAPSKKEKWQRIESDTGFVTAIDSGSVERASFPHHFADAIVCVKVQETKQGGICSPWNMRQWRFDCEGHFLDFAARTGLMPAPPRSVAGQLAALACGTADTRPAKRPDEEATLASKSSNAVGPAGQIYRSKYFTAGFLIRAGAVCSDESKRTLDAAFNLLGTSELKKISQAFPDSTKQWMTEGADTLNTEVMNDGIDKACTHAERERDQAEEIAKTSTAREH